VPTAVARPDARLCGDEPSALRRALPAEIPVWAGGSLRDAAAAASAADDVLVDDGFQDPTLPRSADLVVVDATAPDGVLPAGPLREPLDALRRADLVWRHKVDEPGARALAGIPCAVESVVAPVAVVAPSGERVDPGWLRGREVALLAGIGRPGSFRCTVGRLGAHIVASVEVADHTWFSTRELERLERVGLPILTTTKDRERLPPGFAAHVLEIEVAVRRGWPAVEALLRRIMA
jgi:tetraacyldisaccharide 4'-kinase